MTSSVEGICRKFRFKSKYVYDFAQHHASRTFVRDTDARHASRTFLCTVPQPLPSRDTHLCTSLPSPATRTTFPFARNLPFARHASRTTLRIITHYRRARHASRTSLRIAYDLAQPCAIVTRNTHRAQLCALRAILRYRCATPSRIARTLHGHLLRPGKKRVEDL